ncbi:hypothetical protein QTP70_006020 [Hemibagrus guttatus]|uniref:Reverse transcriptase domain-containing protein n=1 Tax=Hemibagrus guttatus TaxID=175788 RepID=A0AAE0UJ28_9TELE|nr:hypothetical protein QTP70_006020 [Hemibagrus guttatus]KAK3527030.1 hypothetical protein QTP86_007182 [Hemibagrus guttatus]
MQFAYRANRPTDDAISTTFHLALTHLDNKDTYVRMLFIDFSSAFNTIIPQHLTEKLSLLGTNISLCNWILVCLTGRPHSNHIISKNDEPAYREEVQRLTAWCKANNLSLNVEKMKEMVVDFHSPMNIDGSNVEIVKSTKFFGGGPHLVNQHQLHHQQSPAASLLPAKAEEGSSSISHTDHLLQRDLREHPEQLHHCLVWELHGSQDPAPDSEYS